MHSRNKISTFVRIICFAAIAVGQLFMSGCSLNFSAETLLAPPKLSDEQTEIYNALTASAGRVDLRYPRTGEYRSAFVMHNLDSELSDEAIVFYESKTIAADGAAVTGSVSNLRINFLDRDSDGKWISVYELPADGTEIESVSFSSLGGGKERILISYSGLSSGDKTLSVIDYTDGIATSLARLTYSSLMVSEFTEEGKEQLLCFTRDKANSTATFRAFHCTEDGAFEQLYNTVQLSHEISEYDSINTGSCLLMDKKSACVAIDYLKSDSLYGTDVVYFNGTEFVTAENFVRDHNDISYTRRTNTYTPVMHSQDIDGDGIMDIPVSTVMPGYENLTYPEQLNAFSWYSQKSTGIELAAYTFVDPNRNYVLLFPGRWIGMVTATLNPSENSVTFWKVEDDAKKSVTEGLSFPLLTIRTIQAGTTSTEENRSNALIDGYWLFHEDDEKLIFVKNIMYEGLSLTADELAASLSVRPEKK